MFLIVLNSSNGFVRGSVSVSFAAGMSFAVLSSGVSSSSSSSSSDSGGGVPGRSGKILWYSGKCRLNLRFASFGSSSRNHCGL